MPVALPDRLASLPTFAGLPDFYEDERRRRSPEWDYGVLWRTTADEPWPRWRVSWVIETGEVYAIRNGADPVLVVLGTVEKVGRYPYGRGHEAWARFNRAQKVEQLLAGWAEVDPPTLGWVLDRLALEALA